MLAVMSGQGGIAVLISAVQVYIAAMGVYASDDSEPKDPSDGSPSTAELASGMGLWMAAIVPIGICILTTRRLFPRGATSTSQHPKLSFERTPEDGEFYDTERRFSAEEDEESRRGSTNGFNRSWAIMKRNKVINFSVAYVFIVTLVCPSNPKSNGTIDLLPSYAFKAIFPSVTTSIVSVRQPPPKLLDPAIFIPLHFLAFNGKPSSSFIPVIHAYQLSVSDYLGRTYLPTIPMLFLQDAKHVMFASLARTLFIPVFMLCNTSFSNSTSVYTPFINSDLVYFAILFLFGATNGLVFSSSSYCRGR
jgi:equilibrative nucleoside transporter 1/2/3